MAHTKFNLMQNFAIMVIMAALYAALVVVFLPFSFTVPQFRIADILLPFPYLLGWPMAFALFIGCVIGNFFSFYGPIDIIVGSLLNLVAGLLVANRKTCPHWFLAWLYPTLIIGLGIPAMMVIVFLNPFWIWVLNMLPSTAIVCAIGVAIMKAIERAFPQFFP